MIQDRIESIMERIIVHGANRSSFVFFFLARMLRVSLSSAIITALIALSFSACSSSKIGQAQFDPEVNYPTMTRFGFTAGDVSFLKLSSYEADQFERTFRQAAKDILLGQGMLRVDFSDSPDLLISYSVRERLIIRIVNAQTRGLIWRGESASEINGPRVQPDEIEMAVSEALAGYPPDTD